MFLKLRMGSLKKKGKEINVKRAAELLNLSERTVLNFIKQKKIDAIKVGRDWFIDYASFVSFALKYDMRIFEMKEHSEVSEISEKFPKELWRNGDPAKTDVRESYKAMVKNSYDNWSSLKL